MFSVWVKTQLNHKMTRNFLWHSLERYDPDHFHEYVYEICHELDIPSPLILKMHISNFTDFNIAKFKPSDYVEKIDFDEFTLEYCKDIPAPRQSEA